jgi:hypothetical protein
VIPGWRYRWPPSSRPQGTLPEGLPRLPPDRGRCG